MFSTQQCERIGVFEIKEACRSIDVTKDSKLLIAAATTIGFHVFNVENGQLLKTVAVPGLQAKHVSMSYSDKEILILYDENKRSFIRIYSTKDVMADKSDKDVKPLQEIACSNDF
jgi:translation initiation factor 3 subunit I